MTVRNLGAMTVGGINVAASLAVPQLLALIGAELGAVGEISARIALSVSPPTLPDPGTFAANLGLAVAAYNPATILAALSASVPSLEADLAVRLARVQAAQALLAQLQAAISAPGLRAYRFDGAASALGSELGTAVSGDVPGSQSVSAVLIVAPDAAAMAALGITLATG